MLQDEESDETELDNELNDEFDPANDIEDFTDLDEEVRSKILNTFQSLFSKNCWLSGLEVTK